jgi:hypothetical protein
MQYSPDKKIPIQPRSWIGQGAEWSAKGPIRGETNAYVCRVPLESETVHDCFSHHHFTRC